MAKRIIKWELKDSTLQMIEAIESGKVLGEFDIKKIFPDFLKLTEVQSFLIVYGLKQKLADCGSAVTSGKEKADLAKAKFQDFVDGKLVGVRANGTGAAEAKQLVKKVKEQSKVISLEGLMMKKVMFPDSFTDEDQKKLDELMSVKVALEAKHQASLKKSKKEKK